MARLRKSCPGYQCWHVGSCPGWSVAYVWNSTKTKNQNSTKSVCRSKSLRVYQNFFPSIQSLRAILSYSRTGSSAPACPVSSLLYHASVLSRLAHRLAEVVLLPESACEGGVSHIYLVPSHNCACTFPRPASLLVLAEVRELLRVNSAPADRTAHHKQTKTDLQNPHPEQPNLPRFKDV